MKKITFSRSAQSGRFYTYQFNDTIQDKPTYLDDLARSSTLFNMLLRCDNFKAKAGETIISGYTDKYGNKIIRYV